MSNGRDIEKYTYRSCQINAKIYLYMVSNNVII